jgi:molybdate transport system regulatory protein
VFGHGREELFLAIEECRSLNAAAKKLGMSYTRRMGTPEGLGSAAAGIKLVETDGVRKAMSPDPDGTGSREKFQALEQATQSIGSK